MSRDIRLLLAFLSISCGLILLAVYYFALVDWIDAYYVQPWPGQEECPPDMNCFCFDCPSPKMEFQWSIVGFPLILIGAMLVFNSWWNPKQ